MTISAATARLAAAVVLAAGFAAGGARAQDKPEKKDKLKPYDEVITAEARTDAGILITHLVGGKLYYELKPEVMGQELLWVTSIAQTTAGFSFAGMPAGDRVVRWEQRGDKVLLRDVRYDIRAMDGDESIAAAVERTNLAPIIQTFDVVAKGKDDSVVIDVTALFTKDVKEFSATRALNARSMDTERSFIEEVKAFPINVETKVLATYTLADDAGGRASSGITAMIHHSMVKLPDDPMRPRVHDDRVGYFTVGFTDFGDNPDQDARPVRYVTRWRLEKKDPSAAVSDPVKPIVWYVAREVPEKWKPYVKAGIEDWQPAFEAAGFSNAIIGKYAPTEQEDPDWDAEDARYSSVRWLPADIANAFGPHVHDPRTGEILEADVRMYHNVMKLVRDWYFVQAGPVDPRSQQIPLPDEVLGEAIRFVVAHEVGHSLGLPHNFKASSAYTVAQLRDPSWTTKHGTAPSIMDYARFNYVAQPGDGFVDGKGLMPMVGPYDKFAIEWGYRQFAPGADERAELEKIVSRQVDDKTFLFGGGGGSDPTTQSEDLTGDPIEATALGLKNLERVAGYLVDATSKQGESYRVLSDMYDALLGQWRREMGHVAAMVGGVEFSNYRYGDNDKRYFDVDPDAQREAVEFLLDNALTTPEPFIDDDIVLRLTGDGVAARVLGQQRGLLGQLIAEARISRMAEVAERVGRNAYTPAEMMADLTAGVMAELMAQPPAEPDVYRRNLQRAYVDTLAEALKNPASGSDRPALARAELERIKSSLTRAQLATAGNLSAHAHDLMARIEAGLDVTDQK